MLVAPHRRIQLGSADPADADTSAADATLESARPAPCDLAQALVKASAALLIRASDVLDHELANALDPIEVYALAIENAVLPNHRSAVEPLERARAVIAASEGSALTAERLRKAAASMSAGRRARKLDAPSEPGQHIPAAAQAVARHLRRYLILVGQSRLLDPAETCALCCARLALLVCASVARARGAFQP